MRRLEARLLRVKKRLREKEMEASIMDGLLKEFSCERGKTYRMIVG